MHIPVSVKIASSQPVLVLDSVLVFLSALLSDLLAAGRKCLCDKQKQYC